MNPLMPPEQVQTLMVAGPTTPTNYRLQDLPIVPEGDEDLEMVEPLEVFGFDMSGEASLFR